MSPETFSTVALPLVDAHTETQLPGSETLVKNKGSQKSPGIRYTADCLYIDGADFEFSQDEPIKNQPVSGSPDGDSMPVIEVVTRVVVRNEKQGDEKPEPDQEKKSPLQGKSVHHIGESHIKINSSHLAQILRDTVEYYPYQNLDGESIVIREPYEALFHYWKELNEYHGRLQNPSTEENIAKYDHLGLLLQFLTPDFNQKVIPTQRLLNQKTPTVAWQQLWYLLRAGSIVYHIRDNYWIGCVVEGLKEEPVDREKNKLKRWEVELWGLTPMDDSGRLDAYRQIAEIPFFDGEQKVTDLTVFPREYHDVIDGGKRKSHFETRGGQLCDILWQGYKYANYEGPLVNTAREKYEGHMVIGSHKDADFDYETSGWVTPPWPLPTNDTKTSETAPKVLQKMWLDPSRDSRSVLSLDHLFVSCPVFMGFALPSQKWVPIHVDYIRELKLEDNIPEAIIEPAKLNIINALSEHQLASKRPWSADFIANKGEGAVVLLHGPPGVGKTYTVESIAMRKRRPLISLTISDIGIKEDAVEAALTKWFSIADRWRAIILIDECDIFLDRREHTDMSRNGVVSAFLRKMEYFGGLLFLTTNRIGHIDDAFVSRIHAIVGFGRFDASKRSEIWHNLLEKLSKERKGAIMVSNGAKKFLKTAEVLEIDWNGREIRNALQTAIALAEYEAKQTEGYDPQEQIVVEPHHFREVMNLNKDFKSYLDSIKNRTEVERARVHSWRNDNYNATSTSINDYNDLYDQTSSELKGGKNGRALTRDEDNRDKR
ncbi:hypothetical protein PG989_010631 [Apiospora arundinis]|uniref:P-loop containing nucleoside triphosphate hydrolase protein n=1 Tax=Apiospora arundinis TaxID=335852 RepID=A0ABR2HQ95_9PEZI